MLCHISDSVCPCYFQYVFNTEKYLTHLDASLHIAPPAIMELAEKFRPSATALGAPAQAKTSMPAPEPISLSRQGLRKPWSHLLLSWLTDCISQKEPGPPLRAALPPALSPASPPAAPAPPPMDPGPLLPGTLDRSCHHPQPGPSVMAPSTQLLLHPSTWFYLTHYISSNLT